MCRKREGREVQESAESTNLMLRGRRIRCAAVRQISGHITSGVFYLGSIVFQVHSTMSPT